MFENFGEVYQQIRMDKNLTQKEVCGNHLTISTLSKLERGKLIPNYLLMSYLLEQIDMSFDEFEFLCNQSCPEIKYLIKSEFNTLSNNLEQEATLILYKKCDKYLEKNPDPSIKNLKCVLGLSLLTFQSFQGFRSDVKKISNELWNSILRKKEWYITELYLLNQILFHFSDYQVFDIVDRILERVEYYNNFKNMDTFCATLLLNLSTICLHHRMFERCNGILSSALNVAFKLKRYDFISICWVRQGICLQNSEKIDSAFKILEVMGEELLVKELKKEVEIFYKKIV